MHNKWGRRYKRHKEKHTVFFESVARQVVEQKKVDIALGGVSIEVRLRRRKHWLELNQKDGTHWMGADVRGFRGEDLVSVIADYLMAWAANFPGVQVPPP